MRGHFLPHGVIPHGKSGEANPHGDTQPQLGAAPHLCCVGDVSSPKPFNSFPAELEEATGKTLRDPGQLGRINSLWSS